MGLGSKRRVTNCIRCTGTVRYTCRSRHTLINLTLYLDKTHGIDSSVAKNITPILLEIKQYSFFTRFCGLVETKHFFPLSVLDIIPCVFE